jgi:hypothetical protein
MTEQAKWDKILDQHNLSMNRGAKMKVKSASGRQEYLDKPKSTTNAKRPKKKKRKNKKTLPNIKMTEQERQIKAHDKRMRRKARRMEEKRLAKSS